MTFRWQPFCPVCKQVGVLRSDEPCNRCKAEVDAMTAPIDWSAPLPLAAPPLLRFLRWLGGAR